MYTWQLGTWCSGGLDSVVLGLHLDLVVFSNLNDSMILFCCWSQVLYLPWKGVPGINHATEVALDVLTFSCVPRRMFVKELQGFYVVHGSGKNGEMLSQTFISFPEASGEAENPGPNSGQWEEAEDLESALMLPVNTPSIQ